MSQTLYMTNDSAFGILADAIAGTLAGAVLRLFQNDVPVTPTMAIGDFDVADYTGYLPEAITWLDPSLGSDGVPEAVGIVGEFRPTGSTVGNSIFGALICDAGETLWYGGARLDDAPAGMNDTTDSLVCTVRVRVGPQGLMLSIH